MTVCSCTAEHLPMDSSFASIMCYKMQIASDTYSQAHEKPPFPSRHKTLVIIQALQVLNVLGCHHSSFGIKTVFIINTLERKIIKSQAQSLTTSFPTPWERGWPNDTCQMFGDHKRKLRIRLKKLQLPKSSPNYTITAATAMIMRLKAMTLILMRMRWVMMMTTDDDDD